VAVAATQFASSPDEEANINRALALVRTAAAAGAHIVLLQELFATPYFCQTKQTPPAYRAHPIADNVLIQRCMDVAKRLSVVLPVSVYEQEGDICYNTVAIIDATGEMMGTYRKSHIPDGAGYEEKHYFAHGNTGFRVWDTVYGRIGVGICWDQWFPEAARCMVAMGAEILLYPSAIGSEPLDPNIDSMPHWTTVMRGHAAANMVPVVASNRVGTEHTEHSSITFYGSSFVCDHRGALVCQCDRTTETFALASFDLDRIASERATWGLWRDRRPDLYRALIT
jgi:N-carbamoylputrescine amidase